MAASDGRRPRSQIKLFQARRTFRRSNLRALFRLLRQVVFAKNGCLSVTQAELGVAGAGHHPEEETMDQLDDPTAKGFFKALFDLSFKSYIFLKIIKILYVIVMILLGLAALGLVVFSFGVNVGLGIVALLILAPLYFLLNLIFYRVCFEVIAAIFTISENTSKLVHLSSISVASAAPVFPGATNSQATGAFPNPAAPGAFTAGSSPAV
jgi:hypothetical protein